MNNRKVEVKITTAKDTFHDENRPVQISLIQGNHVQHVQLNYAEATEISEKLWQVRKGAVVA